MDDATEISPANAITRFLAGLQAGMMAVIVMIAWLGVSALWQRHTFWSAPNQMATVFRGGSAIVPGFGPYTASGIAVYVGAKQSGVPESQAIFAGAVSALTSGIAAGTDTIQICLRGRHIV